MTKVDHQVDQRSVYKIAKALEVSIGAIVAPIDVLALASPERKLLSRLKQLLADARLDARDYEYAETRLEQQHLAHDGRRRFEQLDHDLIACSEHNIFSAVDVALYSAQIQLIISRLV